MWLVRPFRPRSLLDLIAVGFVLALLPLAAALVVAAVYVERLAGQSQVAVVRAVEATQGGRLLINQITAMERSARQYLVVRDADLLAVYRDTHAALRRTLEGLAHLDLSARQRAVLNGLDETEQALFRVFAQPPVDTEIGEARVAEFVELLDLARIFLGQSYGWVDREMERLQETANSATGMLGLMVIAVIPTVAVLAAGFATLIVRPLRRIALAIRRLGNEDFATPVAVRGPRDLEELGERLDWLRGRLAELDEQKARFLRHMSHELKTPLTALREGTELLADEVTGPLTTGQSEVVAILRENSLRLQRQIENLLDFHQALSPNLMLNRTSVPMAELVREVVQDQRLAWKARRIGIVEDLEPVMVKADRDKLATVVDNLLSNAIKYSPSGSRIRLELRALDGKACLEVQDAGPGFHPDDRNRVFEPFYQGRTVADGSVKGSGLGLAIAREYTTLHGGTLEIVDGPGGRVRLSLPLKSSQPR